MAIAKAHALIQDHELKLANKKKKKMEELEATKHQMQKELDDHSAKFETLLAQLASKTFLSEEKLRARALVETEEAQQRHIQCLREQIQSLAEQE